MATYYPPHPHPPPPFSVILGSGGPLLLDHTIDRAETSKLNRQHLQPPPASTTAHSLAVDWELGLEK